MLNRLERAAEALATFLLIAVGAIGLIIGLGGGIDEYVKTGLEGIASTAGSISLILLTVGILASALGIERVIRFRRYDQRFRDLEQALSNALGGRYITGYDELYAVGGRICSQARYRIAGLVHSTSPVAPTHFIETVIHRLKETKGIGAPARYDLIAAMDLSQLPADFREKAEDRANMYRRRGVGDQFELYLLDARPPIGFDVLVIDKEHVIISMTPLPGAKHHQYRSLVIEDKPRIASEFSDWLEHFAFAKAIPYTTWVREQDARLTSGARG